MSKYEVDHLIEQWALGKLTAEQAIGQLLLHVKSLNQRVLVLERPSEGAQKLVQSAMAFAEKETEE